MLAAISVIFILLAAYLIPLIVPFAAAYIIPGVELQVPPMSVSEWILLLAGLAAIMWMIEMCS
ncbi:hypothetical protein, partial [Agromyces atrinae]|uniref:hypothetical protein n=1 Tax=Agromyces atrinae TaxID=592376 RepID=UPI0019D6BDCF